MKVHKTKTISTLLICALVFYVYQNYCYVRFGGPFGATSLLIDHHITVRDLDREQSLQNNDIKDKSVDQRRSNSTVNQKTNLAQGGTTKYHFMIIVIPSMPKSKNYRDYLRHRWLNESCWGSHEFEGIDKQYLDFKLMFVIGKDKFREYTAEFIEEMSQYDDIVLIDKVESKKILKDKVLWGMKKSIELYDYKYFIKIDHDTLVDLPHLAKGIQTLPDKNVYTGACKSVIKHGIYQKSFVYCVGNAYILTRDVIEKIAMLTEEETEIPLIPEDGYTGWLVSQVKNKFNLTDLYPLKRGWIVDRFNYKVGAGIYHFDRWFYHWLKGIFKMERAFTCRVQANLTLCPDAHYRYENINSTSCVCDNGEL